MPPRRLLFILVLVLWVINGSLLAWVKLDGGAPAPQVVLSVYTEKGPEAAKLKKEFTEAGLPVEQSGNQPWKHEATEGFRVFLRQSDAGLRKSIFQSMRIKKLPVKLTKEDVQFGPVYKTRGEAVRAQKQAASSNYTFDVEENRVQRTSKAFLLKVGPLTADQKGSADTVLAKYNLKPEQTSTTDVGDGPASASTP